MGLARKVDRQAREERKNAYLACRRSMKARAHIASAGLDELSTLCCKLHGRASTTYESLGRLRRDAEQGPDKHARAQVADCLRWLEGLYDQQLEAVSSVAIDRLVALTGSPVANRLSIPRLRQQLGLVTDVADQAAAAVGQVCCRCATNALEVAIDPSSPSHAERRAGHAGLDAQLLPLTQAALESMRTITKHSIEEFQRHTLSAQGPSSPTTWSWLRVLFGGPAAHHE